MLSGLLHTVEQNIVGKSPAHAHDYNDGLFDAGKER